MKKIIAAASVCAVLASNAYAAENAIVTRIDDGYILSVRGGDFPYSKINVSVKEENGKYIDKLYEFPTTFYGDINLMIKTENELYAEAPLYSKYFNGQNFSDEVILDGKFQDGRYDFVIVKSNTHRSDIYVNGYMIGNNVCQYGSGREMSDRDKTYIARDIKIEGGKIGVQTMDFSKGQEDGGCIDYIAVYKAPEREKHKRKVFVLGDSLACTYYGSLTGVIGDGQTGWGDTLGCYFNDETEVINLANSGQCAKGLFVTVMPSVVYNGREGDVVIIEAGYNDITYSSEEEMAEYMQKMIDASKAAGIIPVLVSPNASAQDYKSEVALTHVITDLAEKNPDVLYINLAELSYNYLVSLYGNDEESATKADAAFNLSTHGGDTLHSSFLGAVKWGEMIAQSMKDNGLDFTDSEYVWTATDIFGNEIVCNVK